jgi:hypothetical protein
MLWLPNTTRQVGFYFASTSATLMSNTRSGTVFAAWTAPLDFGSLLSRAVAAETDKDVGPGDEDPPSDHDAPLDDEPQLPDPWNKVDDLPPVLPPKRRRLATFDACLATGKPLTGAHRRRKARCLHKIEAEGHRPRASVRSRLASQSVPITIPDFNASTLPAAQGAYGGKTEQPDETRGKKKRWTVTELIALGLQLIKWDGRCDVF